MTGDELRALLDKAFEILAESEDELRDLDAAVGDGDLGVTVRGGTSAARQAMRRLPNAATPADVLTIAQQAAAAVEKRGKSAIGDKTVLDALIPSVRALEAATSDEGLGAMIAAARRGIDETTPSVARRGRAAWLGERAQGHPDPGAVAYLRFLEALKRATS